LFGWRWIETGRVSNLAYLALVLALQILGGEPQVGYLTLLCLFGLAWWQSLSDRSRTRIARLCQPGWVLVWFLILCAGAMLSAQFPMKPRQVRLSGPGVAERLFFSRSFWHMVGWGSVGLWLVNRWRRNWRTNPMPRLLLGLGLAACLGAGLTAVQLLPVHPGKGIAHMLMSGDDHLVATVQGYTPALYIDTVCNIMGKCDLCGIGSNQTGNLSGCLVVAAVVATLVGVHHTCAGSLYYRVG
jgi:hypothetical protein